jgi:hypothetical protein
LFVRKENGIAAETSKQHSKSNAECLTAKTCHFRERINEDCKHRSWNHGVFGFLFKFLDSNEGSAGPDKRAQLILASGWDGGK